MGQSVSPAAGVGVGAGVASFPPHPDARPKANMIKARRRAGGRLGGSRRRSGG
jgi:hypothetical protein